MARIATVNQHTGQTLYITEYINHLINSSLNSDRSNRCAKLTDPSKIAKFDVIAGPRNNNIAFRKDILMPSESSRLGIRSSYSPITYVQPSGPIQTSCTTRAPTSTRSPML